MSSNSKAFAASVALLAAIGLAVFGQGIAPSGSIAPMTLDSLGDLSSPGTFMTGVNSGLSGAVLLTSSTSSSVVTLAIPNNAPSGGTVSAPSNLGGANHVMSTGGGFFVVSPAGATTTTSTKFFSTGAAVGGTTRVNNQWIIPGVSGATGTFTILNLILVTGGTESTGALTCILEDNTAATGLTITVGNGSGAGTFYDNAHVYSGNVGDLLDFACTNSTGTSTSILQLGVQYQ